MAKGKPGMGPNKLTGMFSNPAQPVGGGIQQATNPIKSMGSMKKPGGK